MYPNFMKFAENLQNLAHNFQKFPKLQKLLDSFAALEAPPAPAMRPPSLPLPLGPRGSTERQGAPTTGESRGSKRGPRTAEMPAGGCLSKRRAGAGGGRRGRGPPSLAGAGVSLLRPRAASYPSFAISEKATTCCWHVSFRSEFTSFIF